MGKIQMQFIHWCSKTPLWAQLIW